MKKLFFLALLFYSSNLFASAKNSDDIAKSVNHFLELILSPIVSFLSYIFLGDAENGLNIFGFPLLVLWLIAGAVFFTIKLGFVNIRLFSHAIAVALGKYNDDSAPGKVTPLQALFTAISATVGLGNIAGVAIAISIGGPGAVIWMMIAAFFGMSLKFAEVSLGQKYRSFDEKCNLQAGPFYYLRRGLKNKNKERLGKNLGILAAYLCITGSIGSGLMFQANQSIAIITGEQYTISKLLLSISLAILVGFILFGGISRIAKVAEKIVPLMACIYLISCLIILTVNHSEIVNAIKIMFSSAFVGNSLYGGIVGAMISGFRRAAFSNEAGMGTSPIAHAASKTKDPIREGAIALLEPFIDTIVICFMTGIVIVVTGAYKIEGVNGVLMTKAAFNTVSPWFSIILSFIIFLFAFSTMLTAGYYGSQAWSYITKGKKTYLS